MRDVAWSRREAVPSEFPSFMYYTYILKSLKDDGYYYGCTADLEQRTKRHNAGKVRSTKTRRPLIIHYYETYETYETKKEALQRERYFKSIDGYIWLKKQDII